MLSSSMHPLLSGVLGALIASTIPVTVRLVNASSVTIAVCRLLVGAAVLVAWLWWRRTPWPTDRSARWRMVGMGVFFGLHWVTYFLSIQQAGAGLAILVFSSWTWWFMAAGWWLLGNRFHPADLLALGSGLVGAAIIVPAVHWTSATLTGAGWAALSGMLYAGTIILQRRSTDLSADQRTCAQFLFALLPVLPMVALDWRLWEGTVSWLAAAWLLTGATVVGHWLWVHSTGYLRPATSGSLSYASILVAVLLAALVLGEPLTLGLGLGAVCIVGGGMAAAWWRQRSDRVEVTDDP